MSSDGGVNRPLPSLILLGIVDFVCILQAADAYNTGRLVRGCVWLAAGVVASAIGYYWPSIKRWRIAREGNDEPVEEMTLDDPRIYLDIESASEAIFPRTPFILRAEGKYEAHHVQIQPFKLCRKLVTFPEVPVLYVGKPEKSLPSIEGERNLQHDIFHWLNKDWNDAGKLADEDWSVPVVFTYCDPLGNRRFEGTVTLVFHPWAHHFNKDDGKVPGFVLRYRDLGYEFVNPQFKLSHRHTASV